MTQNYHDTYGARGRPYNTSEAMLAACVSEIIAKNPDFTVVKGDLIDFRSSDPNDDASRVVNRLNALKAAHPVFPQPGNHEKQAYASKTAGWYDNLLQLILDPTSPGLPAGFTNFSYDTNISGATEDSVYNYSFDHNGYHFIILDSVRQRDASNECTGHVNDTWLQNDLAANTGKKSFVFLHDVITSESQQIPDEVLREVIGTPAGQPIDMTKIDLDNRASFLAILSTYESDIAGVFMGHIHDNSRYYQTGYDFPFVRTSALIQYPAGYNIYKVYSNGYMQSFYKVPYYTEIARDHITAESGYSDVYWEQLNLASTYDRNFVVTYDEVSVPPALKSSGPANNTTGVALDQPIIITFTKQMATTETQSAVTIIPDISAKTYAWSNSDTTLTISHAEFAANTSYLVTIGTSAKSKDNVAFVPAASFSFTTGTTTALTPPQAALDAITNNITNDPTPTFTGIATDERSTITSVEYRISSPSWSEWRPCTALDGAFNENQELFTFTVTPEITRGGHDLEIRCANAAGLTTSSSFASYSFYYVGYRPEVILRSDGTEIINGDPIKTNPSFEVTVITDKGLTLANLSLQVNGSPATATSTTQQNSNTLTYAYYHPTLAEGTHAVKVQAMDDSGNITTREANNLIVQTAGEIRVFGAPLNHPNPFDPGTQSTTLGYVLSRSANVTINIFDLAGNLIARRSFSADQEGGKAGYNEVAWDGRTDGGDIVGNGIYIYLIIADGSPIQNGQGKIAVFKR